MWGLTIEEASDRSAPGNFVDVWPENWQALQVFTAMGTQWRTGFSGAIGLDYSALPEVWRRTKTQPAERDEVFQCLRVMEGAALEHMDRMRKEKEKK